ncbi:MAG: DUF4255 domain-containing protein [Saccharospirillum sp.]
MPIPDSALYLACDAIATFVSQGIQAVTHDISVTLGAPADVASRTDEDRLNLFFYRVEPSGFQAGVHPQEPWRIRLFCMVTAMSTNGTNQGENDLRLLGLVMALFHDQRILPPVSIFGQSVRLQSVFAPATDEQINQIWSTQGETSYRPSVIYELALSPILQPDTERGEAPRVGAFGLDTQAGALHQPALYSGPTHFPVQRYGEVNLDHPAWVPLISWVLGGELYASLEVDAEATPPATFQPELWVAGDPGATVSLEWSVWEGSRWRVEAGPDLTVTSTGLDPEAVPVALPAVTLPTLTVDTDHDRWQLMLHVTREYTALPGAPTLTLRSHPLLISLYRGSLL